MCCLNDFEMVPVSPFITGITFAFIIVMHQFSVISSVYFVIFSAFFITFLFPDNAVSINLPVLFTLARVKMPRLLLGMVRSVYIFLFHNMFTLPL